MEASVEQAGATPHTAERFYEKYGWVILAASAVLGIVAAVLTTLPPLYVFSSPLYEGVYPMMGALGTALVGFNVLALVMTLIPFRKDERWAWYTLWILPVAWLSQFIFLPNAIYLGFAVVTSLGLILPIRRFFSRSDTTNRVK